MNATKADRPCHWILLRGLAREARHWSDFPRRLEDILNKAIAEGSRVDAIDLPGAGRYSEMKAPLSIAEMAEFVRDKFLEIRGRIREDGKEPPAQVCIVSTSLGGMIASEWLSNWPDELKACVLMNTSFKGFSPPYRRLMPTALMHLRRIITIKDPYERELEVLRMVSNRPEIREVTAKEWSRYALSRPFSRENFFRQLFAAARFEPRIDEPPVPILVLASRKDRMVHPSCSDEIAKRWRAELRNHPTAGHDLSLDDPGWVIEQIVDWWRGRAAN